MFMNIKKLTGPANAQAAVKIPGEGKE